jgi:hypothetical protein
MSLGGAPRFSRNPGGTLRPRSGGYTKASLVSASLDQVFGGLSLMDFVKSRRALICIAAAITFAICWASAISSWGSIGLYVGWIPAAILAPMAGALVWFVWSLVALVVLIGWHVHAAERGGAFGTETSA